MNERTIIRHLDGTETLIETNVQGDHFIYGERTTRVLAGKVRKHADVVATLLRPGDVARPDMVEVSHPE